MKGTIDFMENNFLNVSKKCYVKWILLRLLVLLVSVLVIIAASMLPEECPNEVKKAFYIFEGIVIIINLISFFFIKLQYSNYKYKLTDEEIIIKRGVIFKSSKIVAYVQIQDISYTQNPIDLMLGLSCVTISTAGPVTTIHSIDMNEAQKIVDYVKNKINDSFVS